MKTKHTVTVLSDYGITVKIGMGPECYHAEVYKDEVPIHLGGSSATIALAIEEAVKEAVNYINRELKPEAKINPNYNDIIDQHHRSCSELIQFTQQTIETLEKLSEGRELKMHEHSILTGAINTLKNYNL